MPRQEQTVTEHGGEHRDLPGDDCDNLDQKPKLLMSVLSGDSEKWSDPGMYQGLLEHRTCDMRNVVRGLQVSVLSNWKKDCYRQT